MRTVSLTNPPLGIVNAYPKASQAISRTSNLSALRPSDLLAMDTVKFSGYANAQQQKTSLFRWVLSGLAGLIGVMHLPILPLSIPLLLYAAWPVLKPMKQRLFDTISTLKSQGGNLGQNIFSQFNNGLNTVA